MALRHLGTAIVAAAFLAAGCASAPIKKKDTVDLAKADKLVADGCYDCLTDALAIYERVGVGKARPLVIERIFETDVLLALRLKELAVRANEQFDKARALIPELPATYPAAKYIEIAEAVPADPAGGMPKLDVMNARSAIQSKLAGFRDALNAGPSRLLVEQSGQRDRAKTARRSAQPFPPREDGIELATTVSAHREKAQFT